MLEGAIPEGDFDENPKETEEKETLDKEDATRLTSYDYRAPSKSIRLSDVHRFIYLVFITSLVFLVQSALLECFRSFRPLTPAPLWC